MKTSRDHCEKCFFCAYAGSPSRCCDRYLILGVGFRRGCPVGECDKFLKRNCTEEELEQHIEFWKGEADGETQKLSTED